MSARRLSRQRPTARRVNRISNYSLDVKKNRATPHFPFFSNRVAMRPPPPPGRNGRMLAVTKIQVNRRYRATPSKRSRAESRRIPDLYPLKHRIAIMCAVSRPRSRADTHTQPRVCTHVYRHRKWGAAHARNVVWRPPRDREATVEIVACALIRKGTRFPLRISHFRDGSPFPDDVGIR